MIETLPALTPNRDRSARVIARCHRQLEQRREALATAERQAQRRAALVERLVGAAFCLAYAAAVIERALRVIAHT